MMKSRVQYQTPKKDNSLFVIIISKIVE